VEPGAEAADADGNVIPDFRLLAPEFGEEESTPAITLFPNPASTQTVLSLCLSSSQEIQIQIIDMKGSLVRSWKVRAPEGKMEKILELQGLKAGRYLLNLIQEGQDKPGFSSDLIILD
jgi:hypothetical protein